MATLTPCSHVPCQNLCTVCDVQVARIGSGTWLQCWTPHSAYFHASFSHVSLQDSKQWLVNHTDITAGWNAHLHTWKHIALVPDTALENNQLSCLNEAYIFWDVALCHWLICASCFEITFSLNVRHQSPTDTVSHPRRTDISYTTVIAWNLTRCLNVVP